MEMYLFFEVSLNYTKVHFSCGKAASGFSVMNRFLPCVNGGGSSFNAAAVVLVVSHFILGLL